MTNNPQKKGIIKAVLDAIKEEEKLIQALLGIGTMLTATFTAGIAFRQIIQVCLDRPEYNALTEKVNKTDQLIAQNATLKESKVELESKNSELIDKNQELEQRIATLINCTGSITEPSDGATVSREPNITISVGNCSQTRVWLVAIPNAENDTGNDCYLIGEAVKGQTSQMNAHPLQQSKPYIVRLFKNSENITDIPRNSTDGYSCSAIGASDSLDEVQLIVN
ncbi:hypothetical protein [Crocosphaera sp.]|uniref:hypothetical protein n=1 Tax=Crocosphaera sp. TaxID=2729996 RepID=UPI003F23F250|nr:hypothetical protein [Crocosphaera sp.]